MRSRARGSAALITFALLGALLAPSGKILSAAAMPAAACRAWKVIPSPVSPANASLSGISGTATTDVWAVGSFFDDTGSIIEHWDGVSWSLVSHPHAVLFDVVAISPTEAWAIGAHNGGKLIGEHWDGSTWTLIPAPSPGTLPSISSVDASSSTDVWAVGRYTGAGGIHPLALHWDGTAWKKVPAPDGSAFGTNAFYAVTSVSADDAWAVGYQDVTGGADFQPLIEHWDGSAWTVVPGAPLSSGQNNQLFGVGGTSSDDAWAVGFYESPTTQVLPLIEHWDGTSWTLSPSPPLTNSNELFAVDALSSSEAWVVGASFRAGPSKPLTEHWNGTGWTVEPSQNPGNASFGGVSVIAPTDIWAAGSYFNMAMNQAVPLIEHSTGPC